MALKELKFDEVNVGDTMPPFEHTFQRMDAILYAGASGDFNPIHVDPDFAKNLAGLPDVIAHGLFNMALLGKTITDWIGDPGNLKKYNVEFRGMVNPGHTVTFTGTVIAKNESEKTAELEVWAENQDGKKVLSGGKAVVKLA